MFFASYRYVYPDAKPPVAATAATATVGPDTALTQLP
jgi:hypothetical protein